jgi:type I restriction-modification system DNA methylase subunit
MNRKSFTDYLGAADFKGLFNEMGWDHPASREEICFSLDEREWVIREAAQKCGFHAYVCETDDLPQHALRRKLDVQLRRYGNDYLLVFVKPDAPFRHQWQVPVKTVEKRELVAVEYAAPDQAAFLFEKIEAISFGLTDAVSIVDVTAKVHGAFTVNAAKITKDFYTGFRKQHDSFATFIEGLPKDKEADRQWYASVMLNRLMFCYFIQKKGFLNLDLDYLQTKLRETQQRRGRDAFFGSFYKAFLSVLFRDGLNAPRHDAAFEKTFGRIPYLNGGLFEEHAIEKDCPGLNIQDRAFEDLFAFFDKWNWHLDTRITASGRDINPDVLGYIFEQYINDRARMGAYYTKEDITEYIAKNCIIPFLFDAVAQTESAKHFKPGGSVWKLLKDSGDTYIYEAVKKGVSLPLPPEIERGVAVETAPGDPPLRKRRAAWNAPADARYALPTEIWRETVARRQRCLELRRKIAAGEITSANDLVTCNLDIRGFAENVLESTTDHLLVLHFYKALLNITVLDPTCGSGAFLFAALNILEPLYEICITRMQEFHRENKNLFKDELAEIENKYRSNIQHYIYKSIILRNLYGVDIMREATEIAKLRLFLKMVAVVDVDRRAENLGLDPLPDIDFNIRCGNSLVGFANEDEILKAYQNSADALFAFQKKDEITAQCETVALAFKRFKEIQLSQSEAHQAFVAAKADLNTRLRQLRAKLDGLSSAFAATTPFHWIAEFYEIIKDRGGFDVIIGNPPYVEIEKVKEYSLNGYQCKSCGNLYAVTMERCASLAGTRAWKGFIVPVSSVSTDGYLPLQNILKTQALWYSSFDDRPSRLFDGIEHIRLTIHIMGSAALKPGLNASRYNKWNADERETLFECVRLHPVKSPLISASLPKLCDSLEDGVASKIMASGKVLGVFISAANSHLVYYSRKIGYFTQVLNFIAEVRDSKNQMRPPSEFKEIRFSSAGHAAAALLCLNSNLFYWFCTVCSDCRHVNKREIEAFPVDLDALVKHVGGNRIISLATRLMENIRLHSEMRTMRFKHDTLTVQCIIPKHSKPIIDEIDAVLAKHYGLTDEELDFIINYDIKYRMGSDLGEECPGSERS